jgi:hypothetical protein
MSSGKRKSLQCATMQCQALSIDYSGATYYIFMSKPVRWIVPKKSVILYLMLLFFFSE